MARTQWGYDATRYQPSIVYKKRGSKESFLNVNHGSEHMMSALSLARRTMWSLQKRGTPVHEANIYRTFDGVFVWRMDAQGQENFLRHAPCCSCHGVEAILYCGHSSMRMKHATHCEMAQVELAHRITKLSGRGKGHSSLAVIRAWYQDMESNYYLNRLDAKYDGITIQMYALATQFLVTGADYRYHFDGKYTDEYQDPT